MLTAPLKLFRRGLVLPLLMLTTLLLTVGNAALAADAPEVGFDTSKPGQMAITVGGQPVTVFYYEDTEITRPFFAHIKAPSGIQVSRNHPPVEGQDLSDHGTYHPGLWMSFGDISGSDYWRIKARVKHVRCPEAPQGGPGKGTFTVLNQYLDQKDESKVVCEEICHYTFLVRPEGYLLLWDATFSSDHEFYFGDQEEMGLGFRVATPIRVEKNNRRRRASVDGNGTILDSEGRKNGDEIWGNTADWCDYSGTLEGQRVGMTIFCHPDNFRPSWFHARDYGLLEANPFGREAFNKGEKSKVLVKPGEKFRLRYGVLIHSGPEKSTPDLKAAYADYLSLTGN